jgi:catechol 2,3-dioxygenase-like lactoylglutathione lyase family enzyme
MKDATPVATVAVSDLDRAKAFYSGRLGLAEKDGIPGEVAIYASNGTKLMVYRSTYAGTNQATAVSWSVPDVDATVKDLKAKGVAFEHYDMPGATHDGDVHVMGEMRIAWFKDPDGNIHALMKA